MLPVNGRPPYQLGHKGAVPEARTRTCDLLDVDQALWPLSYSGVALEDGFEPPTRTPSTCRSTSELLQQLDPTPGIEPGRGSSADRRLPTWPGRVVWHQGKDLNPHPVVQSHVSYRLDHPGVRYGALDGDRTRHLLLDRQSSPPGDHEGARKKRDGGAPGRIRTSTAAGRGVTARWARLCPSRRSCTTLVMFGLPCLFGFQCAGPGFSGQKKKGAWRRQAPLSAPC